MAERPRINFAAVIAHIGRARPEDGATAACEVAVDMRAFLADECEEQDCDLEPAAHLTILDLAAALLVFGGSRRGSAGPVAAGGSPPRACELAKAVAASGNFAEAPPCSCLGTPVPSSWH